MGHSFSILGAPPWVGGRGELTDSLHSPGLNRLKSAGHQLASPADLPTKATQSAKGTNRLVISREILPTHSSTTHGGPI